MLFEAGDEAFFFGDLVAGFFDQLGGGSFDVIRVHHSKIQSIKFAANREDFFGQSVFVLADDFFGDVEIELVVCECEPQAPRGAGEGINGWNFG